MPFERCLESDFVKTLNKLYENKEGWWRGLADDHDVFIAIRNNSLNAYVHGGSIGKITWNDGGVSLLVHPEYLVFPAQSRNAPYPDLLSPNCNLKSLVIADTNNYMRHLARIKQAVKCLAGQERMGENLIATRIGSVLDMEAAFSVTDESPNPEFDDPRHDPGRIDLVAVSSPGSLVFTEAKLFANGDLRSTRTPRVCEQLILYHRWLRSNSKSIAAAYAKVLGYHKDLKGQFFKQRHRNPNQALSVDPIPRLLIFGFDRLQQKILGEMTDRIVEGVCKHISGFTSDHVRTVGKPGNVQEHHIH